MTDKAPDERAVVTSRELRRRRARRLAIGFAVWVGLPTLIAIVYYGFLAAPQYESVAIIAVESSERSAERPSGLESFLPHPASSRDLRVATDYIKSRAMLERLVVDHGFVAHYGDESVDRWSRLADGASRETIYGYYDEVVKAEADAAAGTINLRVRAFSAAKAHEIGEAVVAAAEAMMNELSSKAWKDQIALGEREVAEARLRLTRAIEALAAAGPSPDDGLVIERDLARRRLESASLGLEDARSQEARERRYLIAIAPPSLPDEPSHPRRLWGVATVFVLSLALAGVLSLLIAAVREHARF
jgi:capsule polysaccharide export protein KpsE/RkpR